MYIYITHSSSPQTVGVNYTLTCQIYDEKEPDERSYQWFKDDLLLTNETSDMLSFSPLRDTDSGYYTCEVTTGSMDTINSSVDVTVMSKYSMQVTIIKL